MVYMKTSVITLLGAGNMGSSLLSGLIRNHYPAEKLWITDPSEEKLHHVKNQFPVNITTDNQQALQHADVVILAVKPQILPQVLMDAAAIIQQKKPLVISIAAGVREASIQQWLGGQIAIVRSMPNTPALLGCGASALYANTLVSAEQHALAESILRSVGITVWLEQENLMDTVTALSGSGPAYFFLMMEALQNAAIECGLPPETARLLTLQTAYGAARMALESDIDVVQLRKNVTSPGGTTEQAVRVLEEGQLRALLKKAVDAAKKRSEELG